MEKITAGTSWMTSQVVESLEAFRVTRLSSSMVFMTLLSHFLVYGQIFSGGEREEAPWTKTEEREGTTRTFLRRTQMSERLWVRSQQMELSGT